MPNLHLNSSYKHLTKCSILVFLAQLLIAAVATCATLPPDLALHENLNNGNLGNEIVENVNEAEKRAWQSLQGSWGKRSISESNRNDAEDEVFLAERWLPVLLDGNDNTDPLMKYTLIYLTNAAILDRLNNQGQMEETGLINDSEENDGFLNEKRTWKNMNVAWGKRRNAPAWNKFRGAWGKREPGWNNLKGMWGKRANKDWQKLHAGWGKRSPQMMDMN
ncbi:allatostatins MIP-like [Teleopsis dalmanni]|uniref:allatostatins MIP-like n=1 Tax=Teleopsis dalmanni TaxID=139649 RepID=UPI000D32C867|nr:allatostatins MIP-like [Teleopsis dalmanni]